MFFGRKSSKISAYEALIKYDISSLPIPVSYNPKEIKIFTLQFLADYHQEDIHLYYERWGYRGFITYEPVYHRYIIFVNAEDSEPLRRWCISLAIGYIENHKIKANCGIPITSADKFINDFAYVYTCPDCILKRDGILSSEKIIEVCKIPFQKAHEKSKRLALLSKTENPQELHIEKIICNIFKKISVSN